MYKIERKRRLNDAVTLLEVSAPLIARRALPGQFVILRIDEPGERIPLTIADCDAQAGTVSIIFQHVGFTTRMLAQMEPGDALLDFAGPLGRPTQLDGVKKAVVIGGGVGCAIAYPQAKYLFEHGAHVDIIAGFRSKDIVILEQEMRAHATSLLLATDDGSAGFHGFVTDVLREKLEQGEKYDLAIAIGPVPMMRAVCAVTKPFQLHTIVSLNPIMIDGTGMCGGCRVTVGGKMRFACVDGPDFDGHEVDFDELMKRNAIYKEEESRAAGHVCRLAGVKNA